MTFQRYTRQLMKKYGFNQIRLAEATDTDPGQMSRLLAPDYPHKPLPATVAAFCTAMGCDADERLELYRLAGKVPPEIVEAFCSSTDAAHRFRDVAQGAATFGTAPREVLMWAYARSKGADSIAGLHVCDDYRDWERELYAMASLPEVVTGEAKRATTQHLVSPEMFNDSKGY